MVNQKSKQNEGQTIQWAKEKDKRTMIYKTTLYKKTKNLKIEQHEPY